MERRMESTAAVLAALFVLFSAMIDPAISVVAAIAGLGALALLAVRNHMRLREPHSQKQSTRRGEKRA